MQAQHRWRERRKHLFLTRSRRERVSPSRRPPPRSRGNPGLRGRDTTVARPAIREARRHPVAAGARRRHVQAPDARGRREEQVSLVAYAGPERSGVGQHFATLLSTHRGQRGIRTFETYVQAIRRPSRRGQRQGGARPAAEAIERGRCARRRRRACSSAAGAAAPGARARAARRGCRATRPSGARRRSRRRSSGLRRRIAAPGHRRSTSARPARGRAPRRDVRDGPARPAAIAPPIVVRRRDAADRMAVVVRWPRAASRSRRVEYRSAPSARAPRGRSSRLPHDHADRVSPPGPLGHRSAWCRRRRGAAVCRCADASRNRSAIADARSRVASYAIRSAAGRGRAAGRPCTRSAP